MRKDDEDRKLFRRAKGHKISTDEVYTQMGYHGVFVIFLSRKIAVDKNTADLLYKTADWADIWYG